jgi:hypothetical protein
MAAALNPGNGELKSPLGTPITVELNAIPLRWVIELRTKHFK